MHGIETIKRLNVAPPAPTRCRPGDLAVVVRADLPENLGQIVHAICVHDRTGDIVFALDAGPVWWCECSKLMTWTTTKKVTQSKAGPVPDNRLQPIRGEPLKKRIRVGKDLKLKAPEAKEVEYVQP